MTAKLPEGATLGADRNYDAEAFVEELKARKIVPHVAVNSSVSKTGKVRKTYVPTAISQSEGYAVSMVCRKRIEEIFGWTKTIGGLAQLKLRGIDKVKAVFIFSLVAYNLIRLPKLLQLTGGLCHQGGK